MITVSVKVDMSGVGKKLDLITRDKGLGEYAASRLADMMRHYIPERDSILIDSYTVSPWKLKYTVPYARPMYYGIVKGTQVRFHKATARTKWDTHVDKQSYAKELEGYIKSHG